MKKATKKEMQKCGVYLFTNTVTNKIYIGSTVQSFDIRFNHHVGRLRTNSHKNQYFQNIFNKYGEDSFEFSIVEVCEKDQCLIREQYFLNTMLKADLFISQKDPYFREYGININPIASGTPNMSMETIGKRTKTFKNFVLTASKFYKSFKSFDIDFDDIPEEYHLMIQSWINNVPWNKGEKYKSTNHLKVKKTMTDEFKENRRQQRLDKMPEIDVFDLDFNFLKRFKNAKDLERWSMTDENDLPVISRFKGESRMGVSVKTLQYVNIIKALRTGKPYKGLQFKHAPSSEETH